MSLSREGCLPQRSRHGKCVGASCDTAPLYPTPPRDTRADSLPVAYLRIGAHDPNAGCLPGPISCRSSTEERRPGLRSHTRTHTPPQENANCKQRGRWRGPHHCRCGRNSSILSSRPPAGKRREKLPGRQRSAWRPGVSGKSRYVFTPGVERHTAGIALTRRMAVATQPSML